MNINTVLLGGNLTRLPELKHTPGGNAVCNVGIAVNDAWTDKQGQKQERTTFVDCEAWGKTGELIAEHLDRGDPIVIEGRLKLDQWKDRDGKGRSKLMVTIERFHFVGGRKSNQNRRTQTPQPASQLSDDDLPY